jgi:phage shock protein C
MNLQKRLYRSTQDRMFAGVCGGIGEYLDVDPTLVRLVFVALSLLSSGSGLVIYIILMLIVPEQPAEQRKLKPKGELAEKSGEDAGAASPAGTGETLATPAPEDRDAG